LTTGHWNACGLTNSASSTITGNEIFAVQNMILAVLVNKCCTDTLLSFSVHQVGPPEFGGNIALGLYFLPQPAFEDWL
jgi:hypothetical protein